MHTRRKNQPETLLVSRNWHHVGGALLIGVLLSSCASPGPPLPPTLNLPEIATDLAATRSGDQVRLHWTTPARTTDRLTIRGPISAAICRHVVSQAAVADLRSRGPVRTGKFACDAVARVQVSPGESEGVDSLPITLRSGVPSPLAYRIELLNAAGRSAGVSAPAFAASGPAPTAVESLQAKATKTGVVLEWQREPQAGREDTVVLTRNSIGPKPSAPSKAKPAVPGIESTPAETRFSVSPDVGGSLDRTVQIGQSYAYTVERLRTVKLGDETLEVRSEASAPVTVVVRDVFPPEVPAGLVAVPAFRGEGAEARPSIDLSWDPDLEPRLAGYRVYRRDLDTPGDWRLLTPEPIRAAAFSDTTVETGKRYAYRVTGVSDSGVESAPSAESSETAPTAQ